MSNNGNPEPKHAVDVGAQRIAHTYAEALVNAATKQGRTDDVIEELDSLVHDLFKADPSLEAFLSSRAIGREEKQNVIQKVFSSRASDTFTNFLLVLNTHDRLDLLRPILAAAREIHEQRTGRIRVKVQTAVSLPEDQRERLVQQLRASLHREPVLQSQVDPSLLGGMVVRVGDWLYDASVRTRLETLRKQLIERSSYEIQAGRDRFCTIEGN